MKRNIVRLAGFVSAALLAGATSALAVPPPTHGLVKGVDGGLYLPYKTSVVRETQQALEHEGIYGGAIDGVLDPATMKATAEFQKQHGLQVSGVPSPRTREALDVG